MLSVQSGSVETFGRSGRWGVETLDHGATRDGRCKEYQNASNEREQVLHRRIQSAFTLHLDPDASAVVVVREDHVVNEEQQLALLTTIESHAAVHSDGEQL